MIINKGNITNFLAWLLFFILIFLVLPSGFRGDVGPDSYTYRIIYNSIQASIFDTGLWNVYGFEPGSILVFSSFKGFGFSYEALQLALSLYSCIVVCCIFARVKSINFLIFSLFYLCFSYYQIQWSVIRNLLAFWTFCFMFVFWSRGWISAFIAGSFHYSFLTALFKPRLKYFAFGAVFLFLLLYFYIKKYSGLDYNFLYEFFWGGWARFLYHLSLIVLILWLLGFLSLRRHIKNDYDIHEKIFIFLFVFGMLFPLGWRLVAVATPFLLFFDFDRLKLKKIILLTVLMFFLFLQKSYSFYVAEYNRADITVFEFLVDFYF
jgi:hypothetical protein